MEGFGGSTGVSKGYIDRAIAQSTAIPQTAIQNWRAYNTFQAALTANINTLAPSSAEKAYVIAGIINGGATLEFTLTRRGNFINALDNTGATWVSTDGGANWTVTQLRTFMSIVGTYTGTTGKSTFAFQKVARKKWLVVGNERLYIAMWTTERNFVLYNAASGEAATNYTITGDYTVEINGLGWYDNPWAISIA